MEMNSMITPTATALSRFSLAYKTMGDLTDLLD
jgi:hypothetical protein